LQERYRYERDTGRFIRIIRTGARGAVGSMAGSIDRQGYCRIWVHDRLHAAHRLAWLYVTGEIPDCIDHINGARSDNRWENLRSVSRSVNLQNQRRARSDNKLGALGVRVSGSGFDARIWVNGRGMTIGTFRTIDEASQAYVNAKRQLHEGCTI
jgi:hypothetical protein